MSNSMEGIVSLLSRSLVAPEISVVLPVIERGCERIHISCSRLDTYGPDAVWYFDSYESAVHIAGWMLKQHRQTIVEDPLIASVPKVESERYPAARS